MITGVVWIAIGVGVGVGVILVLAVVVGIVDAASAPVWRQVARERRQRRESRYENHARDDD